MKNLYSTKLMFFLLFYAFTLFSITGQEQLGNDIDGLFSGDQLGRAVSISNNGTRVAVGAPFYDDGSNNDAGQVRIFDLVANVWTQVGNAITGPEATAQLGSSVSISGDGSRVAVGIPGVSEEVRVYELSGGSWTQLGSTLTGGPFSLLYGESVSLSNSGEYLVVGAPFSFNGFFLSTGKIVIYQEVSGEWVQQGSDIYGDNNGDSFGFSVSFSPNGNEIAVGAWGNNSTTGLVRFFELDSPNWSQERPDILGVNVDDQFGFSVSLSANGTRVAIGAPHENNDGLSAGSVSVYEWDNANTEWDLMGARFDGDVIGDLAGNSVSISATGDRVAFGAPFNTSTTGQVKVFDWDSGTSTWTQVGVDIMGESTGDLNGVSVELTSSGLFLITGAAFNTANAGHARVYDLTVILPVELVLFEAKVTNKGNKLFWVTASELNSKGFEIQISDNATDWRPIGFVNSRENAVNGAQYEYVHHLPRAGINYYRLKQIDYDGAFEYSKTVVLNNDQVQSKVQLFPNPSSELSTLVVENKTGNKINIRLANVQGKTIWLKKYPEGSSYIEENFWLKESGVYIITIISGETIQTEKLVILDDK